MTDKKMQKALGIPDEFLEIKPDPILELYEKYWEELRNKTLVALGLPKKYLAAGSDTEYGRILAERLKK